MYPTTHLLAQTLNDEKLRDADPHPVTRFERAPRRSPRWWRLQSDPASKTSEAPARGDVLTTGLRSAETPT